MKVKSGFITIPTPQGDMEVYFSHLEHVTLPPVLIVFQESFGVNDHIQDVCRRFAQEGYFVFSPEFYHREGKNIQFEYSDTAKMMKSLQRLTEENLIVDMKALMGMISEFPQVDRTQIATVGFCVGGYISMLAGIEFDLSAVISFYGAGMIKMREGFSIGPIINQFSKIHCPVLLFFGEKDTSISQNEVMEIQNKLEECGVEFRSVVFKGAKHGFFCDKRISYDEQSAQEAWETTLKFLEENITSLKNKDQDSEIGPSP